MLNHYLTESAVGRHSTRLYLHTAECVNARRRVCLLPNVECRLSIAVDCRRLPATAKTERMLKCSTFVDISTDCRTAVGPFNFVFPFFGLVWCRFSYRYFVVAAPFCRALMVAVCVFFSFLPFRFLSTVFSVHVCVYGSCARSDGRFVTKSTGESNKWCICKSIEFNISGFVLQ